MSARHAVLAAALLTVPGVAAAQAKPAAAPIDEPRRIAAAVVAADLPAPRYVAQLGAHYGEFLSVFLDRFPKTRGLWTEPDNDENTMPPARRALARFGDRVEFRFGCGNRDLRESCIGAGADVIITDWMSILQNLDGIYRTYALAAGLLPHGGWLVVIDKVGFGDTAWDPLIASAGRRYRPEHEAPGVHHPEFRTPTTDEQLGAMRAAGLDARVVWRSFGIALIMGRKP